METNQKRFKLNPRLFSVTNQEPVEKARNFHGALIDYEVIDGLGLHQ